jgi:hypothetical protein
MMGRQAGDQSQLFYLFNSKNAFQRAICCAGSIWLPPARLLCAGRTREVRRALARAVAKSALNTSKKSFRNFAEIRAR